jgi:hypothetical protein
MLPCAGDIGPRRFSGAIASLKSHKKLPHPVRSLSTDSFAILLIDDPQKFSITHPSDDDVINKEVMNRLALSAIKSACLKRRNRAT